MADLFASPVVCCCLLFVAEKLPIELGEVRYRSLYRLSVVFPSMATKTSGFSPSSRLSTRLLPTYLPLRISLPPSLPPPLPQRTASSPMAFCSWCRLRPLRLPSVVGLD